MILGPRISRPSLSATPRGGREYPTRTLAQTRSSPLGCTDLRVWARVGESRSVGHGAPRWIHHVGTSLRASGGCGQCLWAHRLGRIWPHRHCAPKPGGTQLRQASAPEPREYPRATPRSWASLADRIAPWGPSIARARKPRGRQRFKACVRAKDLCDRGKRGTERERE